ncbi:MAG: pyridoxal kinase [Parvibaculaceae bacterium]
MSASPTVLTISSQVVYGPVGNSAAVPAMQRLGLDVLAVPTMLLSNHPGHSAPARQPVDIAPLLMRLLDEGRLDGCRAVLTGYLASREQIDTVAAVVEKLKSASPETLYLCDPVIGDDHTGLYVPEAVASGIRDRLVPLADAVTPNRFELAWLSGREVTGIESAIDAARILAPERTLATSIPCRTDCLATMAIGRNRIAYVETRKRERVPHGTGDLLAGLFLAHLVKGKREANALAHAVAGLEAIIDASEDRPALDLARGLESMASRAPLKLTRLGEPDHLIAGADGCPGGWLTVFWNGDKKGDPSARVVPRFSQLLDTSAEVIAIDMPIGFPDWSGPGSRRCEAEARLRLGQRQSSVFAVPSRAAVMAMEFSQACAVNFARSEPPRRVSKQCFMLFPKMREVDASMTPDLQSRVFEIHPELAFWAMNDGQPLGEPKKVKSRPHPDGMVLRRDLLRRAGFPIDRLAPPDAPRRDWAEDDLLDACAAAWSARRIRDEENLRLPADPQRDGRGLRMEINA